MWWKVHTIVVIDYKHILYAWFITLRIFAILPDRAISPPPPDLESFEGVVGVRAAELAGVADKGGRLGVVGAVHLLKMKLTQDQVGTSSRRRRWKVAGGGKCRGEGECGRQAGNERGWGAGAGAEVGGAGRGREVPEGRGGKTRRVSNRPQTREATCDARCKPGAYRK